MLEYLPTNWDYLKNYNYIQGVNVGKYSSTMDPLGYQTCTGPRFETCFAPLSISGEGIEHYDFQGLFGENTQ